MLQTLEFVVAQLPLLAVAVLMLLMSKLIFQLFHKNFKEAIIYNNNGGLGIIFGGYMLAVAIGLSGIFFGIQSSKSDTLKDTVGIILDFIILGAVCNCVVLATGYFMHFTLFDVLHRNTGGGYQNHKLLADVKANGSKAPAFVIASHFLAGGIIVKGIMTGESDNFWIGLRDIYAYWAVGMLSFAVASSAFKRLVTPYDDIREIHENNEAAGLLTAGFNVAFATLVKSTLVGASSNFSAEVLTTICLNLVLIPFMIIASVIVSRLVFTPSTITNEIVRDKNLGSALLNSAVLCGIAVLASNMMEPAMLKASAEAHLLVEAEAHEASLKEAAVAAQVSEQAVTEKIKTKVVETQVTESTKDSKPQIETSSTTDSQKAIGEKAASEKKE